MARDEAPTQEGRAATNWVGRVLTQLGMLALIIWIALIGIFAIEQIKVRDGLLRRIAARENEIASQKAMRSSSPGAEQRSREGDPLDEEVAELRGIKERLTALILTGSMTTRGSLPEIECDLVKLESNARPTSTTPLKCLDEDEEKMEWIPRVITLQTLEERSASGALFAVLVITAALGGAVIRLSLDRDRQLDTQTVRSVLRAIGGGIVCYLVLDGGKFPFSSFDLTSYTSPATGSLLGLLAGMFSDRVFRLLSDLVDAFVARLTPKAAGASSKVEAKEAPEPDAAPQPTVVAQETPSPSLASHREAAG